MMGGLDSSDSALAHARELLARPSPAERCPRRRSVQRSVALAGRRLINDRLESRGDLD